MVKSILKLTILSLLLSINPAHLFGQGFPMVWTFDTEEFGAHQQSWCFVEDDNGVLYVGNGAGIVRYDGNKWDYKHIPGSNHVLSMLKSADGTIYYGSEGEFGFLKSDNRNDFEPVSLTSYTAQGDSSIGDVWGIHEVDQAIYFQTSFGFFVWEEDSLKIIDVGFSVRKSFQVKNKLYVKERGGGLHIIIDDQSILIEGPNELLEDRYSFLIPYEDRVLYGGNESGLYLYDGNKFELFSTKEADLLRKSTVYDAIWIDDNEFAIATLDSGLIVLDKNGNKKDHISEFYFSETRLVSNNWVLGLHMSSENQLWVATQYGVAALGITAGIRRVGLLSTKIYGTTIQFNEDEMLVGGYQGFYSFKDQGPNSDFHQVSNKIVTDIEILGNRMLLSTDQGLEVYFKSKKEIFEPSISFYESEIVEVDGHPNIYFTTNKGLYIGELSNEELSIKKTTFTIPASEIIYWDQKLWLKNEEIGLISTNIDSLSSFQLINLNDVLPRQIHQLGIINNKLNVSTQAGLYVYNKELDMLEKNLEFNNTKIENKQVYRFKQINRDSIWFVNEKYLKLAHKENNRWFFKENEFKLLPNSFNHLETDVDGNLWVITNDGVYTVIGNEWEYKTDFNSRVTSIHTREDSVLFGGFGELSQNIIIPFVDNELRFSFASSLIEPENNTYSVQLEGFDETWSNWSSETYKDYTNIPEGEYIFKVRSKNVFEVDGKPDQIAFTVLPPWYRTWWAYMLYFISFSCLLYTGYKIRVNQLLKVERMRNKIASDLHDEVSATLTGISYFAEAIKRDKDPSRSERFVSLISESAGDAKEKITDIVWSINPENDSWELFLSKCRRFASDLLESKELEYTLNITEHVPGKLSMEVRQHLWMIFKEMVTNAVRHSVATRLDVIMDIENGILKLIVQDNGKGFDLDEIQEGNGIRNIQKRAVKIGAVIKIHSEEDFGTRWRMELPF